MAKHYSVAANELRERLKLSFPFQVTLPDPVTNRPFTVSRQNLFDMLLIDSGQVEFESQTIPVLYAEMARCQRGAERAKAAAEIAYRKWRSGVAREFREKSKTKVTEKAVEEAYRTHEDYETYSDRPNYFGSLISLFGDLKEAFKLKGEMVKAHSWTQRSYEDSHVDESRVQARLEELEKECARHADARDDATLQMLKELGIS